MFAPRRWNTRRQSGNLRLSLCCAAMALVAQYGLIFWRYATM